MMRSPFEQMVRLVQPFRFEEPLKYLVSKSAADRVEIQLPLELNHPVVELIWVLRRKAVRVNNEWINMGVALGTLEARGDRVDPPWLSWAALRVNGSELMSAEGEWWRQSIAKAHHGGITAYKENIYGYSFAQDPQAHQPSGSANMSRATSVTLRLTVNPLPATVLPAGCVFDPVEIGGWEVMVWAVHMNWLRFENGMCQRMFSS